MANKTIPPADKHLVLQRLAEGMSTRQAIAGTMITSNSTAAQLRKHESHAIEQHRRDYLQMIEDQLVYGEIERAKLWAEMTTATKYIPIRDNGGDASIPTCVRAATRGGYMTVPDWQMRYKALTYLDQLAGITRGPGSTCCSRFVADSQRLLI